MGNNTCCGVLGHILGLRRDQLACEPKGKTLPGWALWGSGARTVFALGADPLGCIASVLVRALTASYGIGRLFGVSHHLATLKRRRLRRGHRWQLVHDRPEPDVGFGLKAAVPCCRDEIIDRVIADIAQGPHQGLRLVEMAHPVVTPMHDMNRDVPQAGDMVENIVVIAIRLGGPGRENGSDLIDCPVPTISCEQADQSLDSALSRRFLANQRIPRSKKSQRASCIAGLYQALLTPSGRALVEIDRFGAKFEHALC
jgi:hypothetical protein